MTIRRTALVLLAALVIWGVFVWWLTDDIEVWFYLPSNELALLSSG